MSKPRPLTAKEQHGVQKGYMGKIPTAPPPPNTKVPTSNQGNPGTSFGPRDLKKAMVGKPNAGKQATGAHVMRNLKVTANQTPKQAKVADAKSNYQTIPNTKAPLSKGAQVQQSLAKRAAMSPQQAAKADAKSNYQTIPVAPPKPSASKVPVVTRLSPGAQAKHDKKNNYQNIPQGLRK
jgi:hypothetical protein